MTESARDFLKAAHDQLLETAGDQHEKSSCPFCSETAELHPKGVVVTDTTYSESDLKTKIAEATQPLLDKIAGFESEKSDAQIEAQIAQAVKAVKDDLEAKVADLQTKLDEAGVEKAAEAQKAEKAEADLADVLAYLKDESERAEREAEEARLKTERRGAVDEISAFDDKYLDENEDRWAGMSQDDFDSFLSSIKTLAEKAGLEPKAPKAAKIPESNLETASRLRNGESILSTIHDLRDVDVRSLRS